ncbi:MAG: hydrogenase formation protein HypD [Candidatus Eisenbacteria bacterium]|nr:hydrogenase formation protein HypD [Candidatus Eisenbacteria bacterium]
MLQRLRTLARDLPRRVTFMEVCGTHTHAIGAAGLRQLLPERMRLVSGPGCPVCVTPVGYLDHAEALARQRGVELCSFGDLYRVPSSRGSLERLAAEGFPVRIVYSPHDALALAEQHADSDLVFLSIGFETTTPTVAATLETARERGVRNLRILPGNKRIAPALSALARDPDVRIDGLLLPGHVSVITGAAVYRFLAREHRLASVVAGFRPLEILAALIELTRMLLAERPALANLYPSVVRDEGNAVAQQLSERWFTAADADWRGLGPIPDSGLRLRERAADWDASRVAVELPEAREPSGCRCGEVLRGAIDPPDCPLFAQRCTPERPVGACMVSSEGSCAAWFRHERASRPVARAAAARAKGDPA